VSAVIAADDFNRREIADVPDLEIRVPRAATQAWFHLTFETAACLRIVITKRDVSLMRRRHLWRLWRLRHVHIRPRHGTSAHNLNRVASGKHLGFLNTRPTTGLHSAADHPPFNVRVAASGRGALVSRFGAGADLMVVDVDCALPRLTTSRDPASKHDGWLR